MQCKQLAVFGKELQIGPPVLVVKKDDSAVIASLRDMMWVSGSDDAGDSRHDENLLLLLMIGKLNRAVSLFSLKQGSVPI